MKYPRSKPFCSREKINVPADYLNLLVKPLNREVVRRMVQFPWSKVVVFVKSILLTHNPALFCTRTAALKQKLKSIPSASHHNTSDIPNYYLYLQKIRMLIRQNVESVHSSFSPRIILNYQTIKTIHIYLTV